MNLEQIKKIIIDRLNLQGENILLNRSAKDNLEPFLYELKKEISMTYEKKIDSYDKQEKNEKEDHQIINGKEVTDDPIINNDKIRIIENKILQILNKINLNFYKNKSIDLINLILEDFFEVNKELLSDNTFAKSDIEDYITNLINKEFDDYKLKNDIKKKEMAAELLNKIMPEVNEFFSYNTHEKLESMSLYQKNNLIKYFLDSLYKKYLKNDKRLNNEEFHYLKQAVKSFFNNQYNKIVNGDEKNEEN